MKIKFPIFFHELNYNVQEHIMMLLQADLGIKTIDLQKLQNLELGHIELDSEELEKYLK